MTRTASFLTLLAAASGCHTTCGTLAPIWVQADCALVSRPDSGFGVETGGDPRDCEVALELTVNGMSQATLISSTSATLRATATNISGSPVTLTFLDPCPNGLAAFTGLAVDYDFYDSCVAGDCATSGEPRFETLGADESLDIQVVVDITADSCNEAVGPGTFEIAVELPLSDDPQPTICPAETVFLTVE